MKPGKALFFFFPFILLLDCQSLVSFSQEIKGTLSDTSFFNKKIFLWESIGNYSYPVDSVLVSAEGKFSFPPKINPEGYYFLSINDTSRADIILNPSEKEIILEFTHPQLQHGIKIISSEENKLLWEYKLISKSVYNELKNIYIEKSYIPVPPQNAFDSARLNHLLQAEDSLNDYKMAHLKRICENSPNTFFAKSARAALRKKYQSKVEEKLHFFETVDFTDASLIRSAVFPSNMMDYLQKYTEYHEEGFRASIDTILARAKENPAVFEFCLNYLLELFDKVGPDIIFQYLTEKYLIGEGCSETDDTSRAGVSKSFKEKAEAYRLLLPGNKAPEITVPDKEGKEKNLSGIVAKNKITVLFFWSSHCNFCHKAIPGLAEVFSNYHSQGLEVVAISLDENKGDWEKYITENKLSWINLCDFKGWKSLSAEKYKIHKTPFFYLLDDKMTILSKPPAAEDLKREVGKYF